MNASILPLDLLALYDNAGSLAELIHLSELKKFKVVFLRAKKAWRSRKLHLEVGWWRERRGET